jgi:micrococcal nuclease
LLVIGFSFSLFFPPTEALAGAQDCTMVLRVYDGDTVLVGQANERHLVRLLGIDAPETSKGQNQPGQPFSARSRRHLAKRVLNRCVELTTYGDDRYGRRLAVIHLERVNINLEMVSLGLAEVYRGRTPEGFNRRPYEKAAEKARRNGRGMWIQGPSYRSPIDWKHQR